MSLVSTEWLNKNHSKVKIIDATWHMPNTNRNAYEEYKAQHINNAIFFDIDKFLSGINLSIFTFFTLPIPLQLLQAPFGELNEKLLGSGI